MNDTMNVLQQLGIAAGGVIATIAAVKVQIKDLERRMKDAEDCLKALPNDYVPRRELSHTLRNLDQSMLDLKAYVRMIARRNRRTRKETTNA